MRIIVIVLVLSTVNIGITLARSNIRYLSVVPTLHQSNIRYLSVVPDVTSYDRYGQAHHEASNLGAAVVSNFFGNLKPSNPNKKATPNPKNVERMSEPLPSMDKKPATDLTSIEIDEDVNVQIEKEDNFDEGQEEFDTGSMEKGEDSDMGNKDALKPTRITETIVEDSGMMAQHSNFEQVDMNMVEDPDMMVQDHDPNLKQVEMNMVKYTGASELMQHMGENSLDKPSSGIIPTVRDTTIEDIQRKPEDERMVLDKRVNSYTPKKFFYSERPSIRYVDVDSYSSPKIRYVPEVRLNTKYGHKDNVPEINVGTKHAYVEAPKVIRASHVPQIILARSNKILKSKSKYSKYGPSRGYRGNKVYKIPTLRASKTKPRHSNYVQKSKSRKIQYRPTVSHPSSSQKRQSSKSKRTKSIGKYQSSKYSPSNRASRVKYPARISFRRVPFIPEEFY